jgi:signal transduction histidine kinase/HAMP domain-containing protein
MKLRAKFTFLFIGLVVSMGLVIAFITFKWQRKAIEEQMRERGAGICRTLAVTAAEAMPTHDFTKLRQYIDEIKKSHQVAYLVIMDTTGRVMVHSDPEQEGKVLYSPTDIRAVRAERLVEQRYMGEESEPLYEIALPIDFASEKGGVARVGFSLVGLNRELAQAARNITLLIMGAVLTAIMVVVIVGKKITHPVQQLISGIASISRGDLSQRVRVKSRDEMGEIADAFNRMTDDLQKNRKELEEVEARLRVYTEELKRKLLDLSALNKASGVLISILGLEKKLDLIVNTATSITNAQKGLLIFTDKRGKRLDLRASQGGDININVHKKIAQWVMRNNKPILVKEGARGPLFEELLEKDGTDPIMCAPLKTKNELLGAMAVESSMSGKDFTEADLELFSTFANEVALALENASLTENLIESRELDSFNRITSIIIHDLKSSINGLTLLLYNVEKNYDDPEFRADLIATIADTIKKTEDLIARLTSRPHLLELRSESINLLLQRLVEELYLRKLPDVELIEEYGELPKMMIDADNMERVFENVILNALEAMPNGGKLTIVTRKTKKPLAAVIEIVDTGRGMTEEFINHNLFKPFRTTKRKGLGLALFSCKEIVGLHGGKIEVKSELNRGTSFVIRLPILAVDGRLKAIRKLLGEYLLETESIRKEQLERALKIQVSDKRKIGRILVDLGFVREQEVELALERQQVAERHLCDLLQRIGLDSENDTDEGG